MPGENYIQYILDQLNGVSVRGSADMTRMMNAINMLEHLKKDIIDHKERALAEKSAAESGVPETEESV